MVGDAGIEPAVRFNAVNLQFTGTPVLLDAHDTENRMQGEYS